MKVVCCLLYRAYIFHRNSSPIFWNNLKVFNDLAMKGGNMPTTLVPWDLLTDFERRKDRFRAAEILKFLQYHGYRVWR